MSTGSLIKLKRRINSLSTLRTIIGTMEMVATAKIPKLRAKNKKAENYFSEIYLSLMDVCSSHIYGDNIFTEKRNKGKTCIVAVGGDRGFAGGFHVSFQKELKLLSREKDVVYLPIGKKTFAQITRSKQNILYDDYKLIADIGVPTCKEIADRLADDFKSGLFTDLVIVYTSFISMMTQTPVAINVLPLSNNSEPSKDLYPKGILYEPDTDVIFDYLVPQFISGLLYGAVCESTMSETAARKTAMDSAKKNADELIDKMRVQYNRIRQDNITQEITEIITDISI